MPKTTVQNPLDAKIADILAGVVPQIATALRQHVASLVGGDAVATPTSRRGKPKGRPEKHTYPDHCLYPGCKNDRGGPKYTYMCDEHRDTPKARRAALLAQWKASLKGKSSSRSATTTGTKPKKRKLSAAARKKLSEAGKKRWAKAKKNGAAKKTNGSKVTTTKTASTNAKAAHATSAQAG
jgi:hypothetical protein